MELIMFCYRWVVRKGRKYEQSFRGYITSESADQGDEGEIQKRRIVRWAQNAAYGSEYDSDT